MGQGEVWRGLAVKRTGAGMGDYCFLSCSNTK